MSTLEIKAATPAAGQRTAPRLALAATAEPLWVRRTLIGIALVFLTLFLFVPLAAVFFEAFKKGVGVYLAAITEPDAQIPNGVTVKMPKSNLSDAAVQSLVDYIISLK